MLLAPNSRKLYFHNLFSVVSFFKQEPKIGKKKKSWDFFCFCFFEADTFFPAVLGQGCSMQVQLPHGPWDVSSPTRDQTHIPSIGIRILNHQTTRDVPLIGLLLNLNSEHQARLKGIFTNSEIYSKYYQSLIALINNKFT